MHIQLDGPEEQLQVDPSERSATSVSGRSDSSATSGYSSGYDSESGEASRAHSLSRLRPGAPCSWLAGPDLDVLNDRHGPALTTSFARPDFTESCSFIKGRVTIQKGDLTAVWSALFFEM